MSNLIELRSLTKTYGRGDAAFQALRGVDMDIAKGEFLAVMGPSGSGKSTLMNLLGCLDTPTTGNYRFEGIGVETLNKDQRSLLRRTALGFIFQGFNLLARTSALENVELPLLYRGGKSIRTAERRQRAMDALTAVGLQSRFDHHPNQLSGGQQQRVAIARALITQPSILLADEPTGNLDTRTSIEVMGIFQRLNMERGITVLVITHEMDIAEYGTRIIRCRDGHIVVDHPVEQRRVAEAELQALPQEEPVA